MRFNTRIGLGVLGITLLLLGGCDSTQNQDDSAMLEQESMTLREQLEQRTSALEAANADRRELEMQNSELRRQLEEAQASAGSAGRSTGFEGIEGVSSEYGNGEVTVSIASDILFDSGKNTLKAGAKRSLDQVASVLRSQYAGKAIRIAGHTDTDPIKKSGWKSNYHLGAERAYAVMQYLQNMGIPAQSMHIASFGPNKPMGTKSASRRVEIVVLQGS